MDQKKINSLVYYQRKLDLFSLEDTGFIVGFSFEIVSFSALAD
jgi:hypothetical protein